MKKINPEKFLFELYIGRLGYSVNQVIDSREQVKPGFKLLGYCEARRLPVRPRNKGYAIMVEDTQLPEQTTFWLHVENIQGVVAQKKPPAPSIKLKKAAKDRYTMEEFNKAYMEFRMDKMGVKKEMEDLKSIMRAYRSLMHIFINTDGVLEDKSATMFMQSLQYEFGIRMTYTHGADWAVKALGYV